MNGPTERVLLVENDPQTIDLIIHQVLEPMGYQVELVADASTGIDKALHDPPDLIIVNLKLPDLSGKDLLVALNSQGQEVPVIIMAEEGMHNDILQAVRLGAADYLNVPVRETELVSVLERVLKQAHDRKRQAQLAAQLEETNQALEQRVRDLSALHALGKMIPSLSNEGALHEKIMQAAIYLTRADRGWLLLKSFQADLSLSAHHNLPPSMLPKEDQAWEDGLSTLVALSGEPLSIHGEALSRFKVSKLGRSALVTPIKSGDETAGVIVVMRISARPFSADSAKMLEAVADFATVGLLNSALMSRLDEQTAFKRALETAVPGVGGESGQLVPRLSPEMRKELVLANAYIGMLVDEQLGKLKAEQVDALQIIRDKLEAVVDRLEAGGSASESG